MTAFAAFDSSWFYHETLHGLHELSSFVVDCTHGKTGPTCCNQFGGYEFWREMWHAGLPYISWYCIPRNPGLARRSITGRLALDLSTTVSVLFRGRVSWYTTKPPEYPHSLLCFVAVCTVCTTY